MKDIEKYLRKLEVDEDFDIKDLMISAMKMENKRNINQIQDLQAKMDSFKKNFNGETRILSRKMKTY